MDFPEHPPRVRNNGDSGCQETILSGVMCIWIQLCFPTRNTRQEMYRAMERKGREAGENQSSLCSLSLLPGLFPHWYPKGATMAPSSTPGRPVLVSSEAVVREACTLLHSPAGLLLDAHASGRDRDHIHRLPKLPGKKQTISIPGVLGTLLPQHRMLETPGSGAGTEAAPIMQLSNLTSEFL